MPVDNQVKYIRPDRKLLAAPPRKPEWEEFFVRPAQDCINLPKIVRIVCRRCRSQKFDDHKPRWTRQITPRYILRRPGCGNCHQKNTNWRPEDPSVMFIDPSHLSRKRSCLKENPAFDPADVIQHPDWYFPGSSET